MNFADAEKIAAAVLYEGYMLYPYRASSTKNVQRWNFGTLYPRDYAEAQRPAEPFRLAAECLLNAGGEAKLEVRVRFLQLVRRQAETPQEWEEGIERTIDLSDLRLGGFLAEPVSYAFSFSDLPASPDGASGAGVQPKPISARLELRAEPLHDGLHKLSLEVLNLTPLEKPGECPHKEAMLEAFVSAHALLGVTEGEFVSLLEPPEEFRQAAAACRNTGVFPVLVGEEGQRTMLLCSPIILYDYPQVAPESPGDFFDGTEMDEMLALRVLTLTDEEKREMRTTDDRARRILERTETLPPDFLTKIHGAIRGLRPVSATPEREQTK